MENTLRDHCDSAFRDDPGADLAEMAGAAMTEGTRIRRRRRAVAGTGVAACLAAVLGMAAVAWPGATEPADVPVAVAPSMILVAAVDCSPQPVDENATDAVILPGDANGHVTDQMLTGLQSTLESDARVQQVLFESREQAYEKFTKQWATDTKVNAEGANDPEFVTSLGVENMVPSFRLRMWDATQYAELRADYVARHDVDLIEGRICRTSAPVGGVR